MSDIKYTYFDLRVKGEPARLLLAYAGVKYTDVRIPCPWDDPAPWTKLKPSTPWGQMPILEWKGQTICQSMTICRFIAREFGLAGKTNLEMAQVDEIVDRIQDIILASYKAWYASSRDQLVELTEKLFPDALSQLERRLAQSGGKFMVGNSLTWADIHLFFLCTEEFIDKNVLKSYPLISSLVSVVGAQPNIAHWMKTRPENGKEADRVKIYFKNAYRILEEMN